MVLDGWPWQNLNLRTQEKHFPVSTNPRSKHRSRCPSKGGQIKYLCPICRCRIPLKCKHIIHFVIYMFLFDCVSKSYIKALSEHFNHEIQMKNSFHSSIPYNYMYVYKILNKILLYFLRSINNRVHRDQCTKLYNLSIFLGPFTDKIQTCTGITTWRLRRFPRTWWRFSWANFTPWKRATLEYTRTGVTWSRPNILRTNRLNYSKRWRNSPGWITLCPNWICWRFRISRQVRWRIGAWTHTGNGWNIKITYLTIFFIHYI